MAVIAGATRGFEDLKRTHPEWHRPISSLFDEISAIRRDLHAHPELSFQEIRTSSIVADLLEKWGYKVQKNVGKTGVVGLLEPA